MSQELVTQDQMSIPDVLEGIRNQIKQLQHLDNPTSKYKTKMYLGPWRDLKDVKSVEEMIQAYSYVVNKAARYEEAKKELESELKISAGEWTENGSNIEDWKKDIKFHIEVITRSEKLKKLKELEEEAKQFISTEDKKLMFLNKLTQSFPTK